MNNTTLFLKGLVLPLVVMGVLSACGEKSSSVESELSSGLAAEQSGEGGEAEKPKLEDILRGVWLAESPESLGGSVEKVQLDFRENGDVTMIVFNPGENPPTDGVYEVKGNDLKILFNEDEPVETTYDGKILTVIDTSSGDQVDFEKL